MKSISNQMDKEYMKMVLTPMYHPAYEQIYLDLYDNIQKEIKYMIIKEDFHIYPFWKKEE